jgi:hypothetical protein
MATNDEVLDAFAKNAAYIVQLEAENARLRAALVTANANHERFEREWYLRGDENERLRASLKDLIRQYVNMLESARDQIIALGGDCDSVDVMERGDPYLRKAREALGSADAATGEL